VHPVELLGEREMQLLVTRAWQQMQAFQRSSCWPHPSTLKATVTKPPTRASLKRQPSMAMAILQDLPSPPTPQDRLLV